MDVSIDMLEASTITERDVVRSPSNKKTQRDIAILHFEDEEQWQFAIEDIVNDLGFVYEAVPNGASLEKINRFYQKYLGYSIIVIFDLRFIGYHTLFENIAWILKNAENLRHRKIGIIVLSGFLPNDGKDALVRDGLVPKNRIFRKDKFDDKAFVDSLYDTVRNPSAKAKKNDGDENAQGFEPDSLAEFRVTIEGARVSETLAYVKAGIPYQLKLQLFASSELLTDEYWLDKELILTIYIHCPPANIISDSQFITMSIRGYSKT